MSARVEEFFNHMHGPKDGRFASSGLATGRRFTSGGGKGLFSLAKTSKRQGKLFRHPYRPHARQGFSVETSPKVLEFYNHVHDHATGRFSGRAASGRAGFREGTHGGGKQQPTTVGKSLHQIQQAVGGKSRSGAVDTAVMNRLVTQHVRSVTQRRGQGTATPENFPRGDRRKGPTHVSGTVARRYQAMTKTKNGQPVVGPKRPLHNATTGRINPSQVRTAFKQDAARSAGSRTPGAKRTSGNFRGTIAGKRVAVKTTTTDHGRSIKHNASSGSSPNKLWSQRYKPAGKGSATHTQTKKAQRNLIAEAIERLKKK